MLRGLPRHPERRARAAFHRRKSPLESRSVSFRGSASGRSEPELRPCPGRCQRPRRRPSRCALFAGHQRGLVGKRGGACADIGSDSVASERLARELCVGGRGCGSGEGGAPRACSTPGAALRAPRARRRRARRRVLRRQGAIAGGEKGVDIAQKLSRRLP